MMFASMARATLRRRSDGIHEIVRRWAVPRALVAAAAVTGAGALAFFLMTVFAAYAIVSVPLLLGVAVLAGSRAAPRGSDHVAPAIQLRPRPDEGRSLAGRRS
jgi:hypothetical protein